MEFDQVVKYEFGDDVRDIDWNVTAKLGEPYRKKFVEEREISLILLFEDTPSLQFGSGAKSKREALLELASLIMLLSAVNGDRRAAGSSRTELWVLPGAITAPIAVRPANSKSSLRDSSAASGSFACFIIACCNC